MVSKRRAAVIAVCVVLVGVFAVNYTLGPFFFDVASGSMVPALHIGDLVVINHTPFASLQVGDIIVFHMPAAGGGCRSELIVHRIVAIGQQGITTKGDANPIPDEPTYWPYVTAGCYVGKVVYVIPYLGGFLSFFRSLDFIALVVLVFFVMLFADHFSSVSPRFKPEGSF
ncbi:MAG: signal peptidase I [Nitrososphaerota archaeon]|jgi:signal peptidase|nr:signal peptidase I [Nitrososphaerota archaeon]MDG6948801.1 signal peptidase I [Nitrososphaerota archaeon]